MSKVLKDSNDINFVFTPLYIIILFAEYLFESLRCPWDKTLLVFITLLLGTWSDIGVSLAPFENCVLDCEDEMVRNPLDVVDYEEFI